MFYRCIKDMRLLFHIVFSLLTLARCTDTILETLDGPVRGIILQNLNVTYYAYRGIPYAEPPTGCLRFMPPVPRKSWSEVLDATKFGPICPQAEGAYSREDMSEDCLNLNVYVPSIRSTKPLPVLVFSPSGEFLSNSGRDHIYGPELFMKKDIIMVTYNYRLGALGFLSVQSEAAAGNAGLKDALLALKWVKRNIMLFGGDPDSITLGGDSAGAAVVHYLLLSNKSSGLFNRASLISGSALGYRFLNRHPVETVKEFARKMGYQTENTIEIIMNLKTVDAFDIVAAQGNKDNLRNGYRPFAPFVPVVEVESEHAVITRHPMEILKRGIPQKVPIIVGFNAQEGIKMLPIIRKNFTLAKNLNEHFELCIPSNIEYPYGSKKSKALARSIREFYFNNEDISNRTLQNFVTLISDTQFIFSIDSWIKIYKDLNRSNEVFYYVFDFDGDLNWFKLNYDEDMKGAAHMDQAGYMFASRVSKPLLETASDDSKQTIYVLTTVWSNFVKFGAPTTSGDVKSGLQVEWPDCGAERNYLALNNKPHMVAGPPLQKRMNFWYKVYARYERYVHNGGRLQAKIIP